LLNTKGNDEKVMINFPNVKQAYETDIWGNLKTQLDSSEDRISVIIGAYQIKTIMVKKQV
jgi:hypothetical protein